MRLCIVLLTPMLTGVGGDEHKTAIVNRCPTARWW
jgi:hypothetical protein